MDLVPFKDNIFLWPELVQEDNFTVQTTQGMLGWGGGGELRFQIDWRIINLYYFLPVSVLSRLNVTVTNTP